MATAQTNTSTTIAVAIATITATTTSAINYCYNIIESQQDQQQPTQSDNPFRLEHLTGSVRSRGIRLIAEHDMACTSISKIIIFPSIYQSVLFGQYSWGSGGGELNSYNCFQHH